METPRLYADRSTRGKLRLTGPQNAWFLHQILTQSFDDMRPGEARDAALITAHGRMVGYMETFMTDEAIWMHFEDELRASLPEALGRYVFATQVEINDVSDDYALVLVASADWEEIAGRIVPEAKAQRTLQLGVPAGYLWLEPGEKDSVLVALESEGLASGAEDDLEQLRVKHGMARWGRDMNSKTLPPEVKLDEVAIHYDKGCYVGQEAMAKIKFRGHVNRVLRRLKVEGNPDPGQEIAFEGAKAGVVTSAGEGFAFGTLRYTIEPGAEVSIAGTPATVIE